MNISSNLRYARRNTNVTKPINNSHDSRVSIWLLPISFFDDIAEQQVDMIFAALGLLLCSPLFFPLAPWTSERCATKIANAERSLAE
jgi:hypothetical protein